MTYLLFSLLLIVAVVVTYFVTKKKVLSKVYAYVGFPDELKAKWDNTILQGINPLKSVNIFEKDHEAPNGKYTIPYFGIGIKYIPNDETPNERFYHISVHHDLYEDKEVNIGPTGISDGYHTFDELYYYRLCYNAAFINALVKLKLPDIKVCKSKKHYGGELCYGGGWFIVMISTPWGQISNHYKLEYWDMFDCPVTKQSWKFDGHGMKEAMERLNKLSKFISTGTPR